MSNKQGKIIRNVAVLDLRTATEAAIAGIQRIDNVASVLYAAETAELVSKLSIGNVASMVKVPNDVRVILGQETLSAETFEEVETPLDLYVVGQVTIAADTSAEALRKGLNSLSVVGQFIYPNTVAGVVKAKLQEISGQTVVYPHDAKMIQGRMTLTPEFLKSLADGSSFFVMGRLDAPQVLPNDLLAEKIARIELMGRVTCCEENADTLLERVHNATRTTIIPKDFHYLAQPLVLDANLIHALPGRKLYGSTIRIEPDVTADALVQAVDAIQVTEQLIAPVALREVLASKCNLFETEHVLYDGDLWIVDTEMTIYADRFDYLEDKATLVVQGELTIDKEIDPKALAENFTKIHNWGEIYCTRPQMSAIQARLGTNKGEINEVATEESNDENVIGNAAYMVL